MKNSNSLAIKTFDKLLELSDEEFANYFSKIEISDLSKTLEDSGMFEHARNEAQIIFCNDELNSQSSNTTDLYLSYLNELFKGLETSEVFAVLDPNLKKATMDIINPSFEEFYLTKWESNSAAINNEKLYTDKLSDVLKIGSIKADYKKVA
jgi:hypothetical protein